MLRCSSACLALLLSISSGGAILASGAGQEYSSRIWGLEDGLPNGRIQALTQTLDGYLWIGTAGGLVRFDGQRFAVFDRSNTPALADDSVLSLLSARDGSLWAGTEGGGLVRYDKARFTRYAAPQGLTNQFVRSLYEDEHGTIWAGTDRGVFRKEGHGFVRLDGTPSIPYVNGLHMTGEPSGEVWIGGNGLYQSRNGALVQLTSQRGIRSILARPDGTRWVASFDGLFEWRSNQLSRIHPKLSNAARLLTDKDGMTWVAADGGLYVVNGSSLSKRPESQSLPDDSILALYCDRESNLWVGTRNGLARLSKRLVSAHTGHGDHAVVTAYKDPHGVVWLVTGEGAVNKFSRDRVIRQRIPGLPADAMARTLFEDRNGCFWVGTANQGFFRTRCGPVQRYDMAAGLRNNSVRAFLQDRTGDLWVATGSGLARVSRGELKVFYTDDGLAYGSVRCLLEDRNGDLWVGTDGGLSRMRSGRFQTDAAVKGLAGERIWALHQDATGAVWVGTRGRGLFRIVAGRLNELRQDFGLPRSIYGIVEDEAGTIWMSGASGIVRAERKELHEAANGRRELLKILSYGSAEGMPSVQMSGGNQPAGVIAADSKALFASVGGAVTIDTNTRPSAHVPTAFVEEVLIDGRSADITGALRVPPGTARVDLHFTAPALLSPERVQFWYKLENFDHDWTYASTSRSASYTSLPPGSYTFRLIARNLAAPDQHSEATVDVEWEPRLLQTKWVWTLMAFCTAAAVWAVFRAYARQTKQRYAVLLAERARLAREMHDTVIQGCVGVSSLLEAAASFERTNPSMLLEMVNRARSQVRVTLEEARQAVWDLRHDSMSASLCVSLQSFAEHLSNETGIPVHVEVAGSPMDLDSEIGRNLFAATREAVRNAVKHGRPNSVQISICYSQTSVRIEVVDDGIGFEAGAPRIAAGHYGLLGMRERMEQLGGSLRLLSDRSRGTRVIAELPLGDGGRP